MLYSKPFMLFTMTRSSYQAIFIFVDNGHWCSISQISCYIHAQQF